MQKRARNLAAEELLIEVMVERVRKLFGEIGLNIPDTYSLNIEKYFL